MERAIVKSKNLKKIEKKSSNSRDKIMNIKILKLLKSLHVGYASYLLLVLSLFLGVYVHIFPWKFFYVPLILALIPLSRDAWQGLREKKIKTELFLLLASAIGLYGGQERAIIIVLIIMMIAKYIEQFVEERTERAIESLTRLIPTDVIVVERDGEITREKVVPIDQVHPGMLILIKTGSRIPVDGKIIDGQASINEASLTGESIPKDKGKSELVYAGTFVEAGSVIIDVQHVGESTLFGKITKLLEKAGEKKASIVLLADKIASILVIVLLLFIGIVWFITHDFNLVITLLVFGSPLELTLITPLAILAGVVAAFRNGILVKGGLALERMAHVDTMMFDKTGTLTMGEPKVVEVFSHDINYDAKEVIKIAAMLEKRSGHILAKAILQKAQEDAITVPDPDMYESVTGHGIVVTKDNKKYILGNKHFIQAPEHGNTTIPESMVCVEPMHTSFYVTCDQMLCGRICVTDIVRSNAHEIIEALRALGIKTIILLSGDKQSIATQVGASLGTDQAYGEIAPDAKLRMIEARQKEGHNVCMVGDGINDAPALKQAHVGIAMGAMGMEPAIEASDIVLMDNDLQKIIFVRKLSQKVFHLIKQNIIWGFAMVHIVGMILTFWGIISPIQAALSHAVTDILILINSARLIWFKDEKNYF